MRVFLSFFVLDSASGYRVGSFRLPFEVFEGCSESGAFNLVAGCREQLL